MSFALSYDKDDNGELSKDVACSMNVCGCKHFCVYLWKPEVTTRYLPRYSPPYFMSQGLSLSLELIYSARLAGQQALEIYLSLFTQHWDYRHVPPRLDFT